MLASSVLLAGVLSIASSQALPSTPPLLQGVSRIVCLGDSITQQGESPGGYVWLIRRYLDAIYPQRGIEVINAGISGNRSNDMLARFQKDVTDRRPDLVLISVGVNDVWHGFYDNHPKGDGPGGIPLNAYRANVQKMIDEAKASHSKVCLLLSTLIGEDLKTPENQKADGYNRALRNLAKKNDCGLVDLQRPFRDLISTYRRTTGSSINFLTVDGVHMNALGNQVMAQTILSGLGVSDEDRVKVKDLAEKMLLAEEPLPVLSGGNSTVGG